MIPFVCECGKQLQAREENAGCLVLCPACQRQQTVPRESSPPAPTLAAVQEEPAPRPERTAQEAVRKNEDKAPLPSGGNSGKAVASLVLGTLSVFCNVLAGLPALILGLLALRDIKRGERRLSGHGLAVVGILAACVGSVLNSGLLIFTLLLPAVQRVREAAARTQSEDNFKQMGRAMQAYKSTHGHLPLPDGGGFEIIPVNGNGLFAGAGSANKPALAVFAASNVGLMVSPNLPFLVGLAPQSGLMKGSVVQTFLLPFVESPFAAEVGDPKKNRVAVVPNQLGLAPMPRLSWRVAILPFLGENDLYDQYKRDEPWDSPHNIKLLSQMPKVYNCPGVPTPPGHTVYQGLAGGIGAFKEARLPNIPADFADGTSNSILIVEAAQAVPWTKPEDLPFDRSKPIKPLLGNHYRGGFLVLMADGSPRFLERDISENTLKAAVMPKSGMVRRGPDW